MSEDKCNAVEKEGSDGLPVGVNYTIVRTRKTTGGDE